MIRDQDFPGKDPGESTLLILRRRRILLLRDIFLRLCLLLAVSCIPLLFRYSNRLPANLSSTVSKVQHSGWFWLIYCIVISFLAIRIYAALFNWQHDLYIITDRRIVDYNWYFPFRRTNTDASLAKVQDCNYAKTGFFANLFNYGSLYIEAAAERSPFSWRGLPDPERAQSELRSAMSSFQEDSRRALGETVSGL